MSTVAVAAWRVAGLPSPASVALYGVPPVAALVAYKVAGGGLLGFAVGAVTLPLAFVATGAWVVYKYGPGIRTS